MTKRLSVKLALPFILLLAACFFMAPVSAMARTCTRYNYNGGHGDGDVSLHTFGNCNPCSGCY